MNKLCWSAIWRAAVSVATLAVPLQIVFDVAAGDDTPSVLLYPLVLLCGMIGGFGAAKLAPQFPLQNGAAAAALAYAGIQGVGVIRRLIVDLPISPLGYPLLALAMATCGMVGASLERRTRALREPLLPRPPEEEA